MDIMKNGFMDVVNAMHSVLTHPLNCVWMSMMNNDKKKGDQSLQITAGHLLDQ